MHIQRARLFIILFVVAASLAGGLFFVPPGWSQEIHDPIALLDAQKNLAEKYKDSPQPARFGYVFRYLRRLPGWRFCAEKNKQGQWDLARSCKKETPDSDKIFTSTPLDVSSFSGKWILVQCRISRTIGEQYILTAANGEEALAQINANLLEMAGIEPGQECYMICKAQSISWIQTTNNGKKKVVAVNVQAVFQPQTYTDLKKYLAGHPKKFAKYLVLE